MGMAYGTATLPAMVIPTDIITMAAMPTGCTGIRAGRKATIRKTDCEDEKKNCDSRFVSLDL